MAKRDQTLERMPVELDKPEEPVAGQPFLPGGTYYWLLGHVVGPLGAADNTCNSREVP